MPVVRILRAHTVRDLFLAWLGLFLLLCFLMWISIWFWGMRINLAPPVAAVSPVSRVTRVVPPSNHVPVLNVEEVALSDAKLTYVGRRVEFYGVNVLRVSHGMVWIGPSERESVFVVPSQALPVKVKAGESAAVSGIIFAMPAPLLIETRWGFSRLEAEEIAARVVYLRAFDIEKL